MPCLDGTRPNPCQTVDIVVSVEIVWREGNSLRIRRQFNDEMRRIDGEKRKLEDTIRGKDDERPKFEDMMRRLDATIW